MRPWRPDLKTFEDFEIIWDFDRWRHWDIEDTDTIEDIETIEDFHTIEDIEAIEDLETTEDFQTIEDLETFVHFEILWDLWKPLNHYLF